MMGDLFTRVIVLFGGMGVLLLALLSGGNHAPTNDTIQNIPIAYTMVENPETVTCLSGPCRTGIVLIDPLTGEIETFRLGEVYPETLHYSPDYSMISYHIDERLYVLDLETHRTRFITREHVNFRYIMRLAYNAWSPDSTQIAYLTPRGIETLNLITDEHHLVTHLVPLGGMRWSPDGTRLLFTANPANTLGRMYLYSLDLTTGELTNLSPHRPVTGRGTWSPDGTHIIAMIGGIYRPYLMWGLPTPGSPWFIMDADGSNLRQLTFTDTRGRGSPRWIFENTLLVYSTDFLEWVNVETNEIIRIPDSLAPSPYKVWGMDISPDGTQYVVLHITSHGDLEFMLSIYDLETSERRDFIVKTANFAYPEWGS